MEFKASLIASSGQQTNGINRNIMEFKVSYSSLSSASWDAGINRNIMEFKDRCNVRTDEKIWELIET